VASRSSCRQIDEQLEDVLETVDAIFSGHIAEKVADCLTCDPRPHLLPILDGVRALDNLLSEKGEEGFTDSRASLAERLKNWENYRCPCSSRDAGARRVGKRSREEDARAEIISKCSEKFVSSRRGLLQVFRVPEDRSGCYQSRACRSATVYKGFATKAGFWTYDGEYWYVWAERRDTSGRWVPCDR
jgi:hypothetical protein